MDTIRKATNGLNFAQVTSITNRTRQIKIDSKAIGIINTLVMPNLFRHLKRIVSMMNTHHMGC